LLWLAGRKIIGRSAVWFAVIAIINPWGLQLLTEAIAETTLLFFIWATFYFIFIRSKWAYLFAALTTMVRYEGVALILGAFVMDMIEGKNKKERIMAFVYASMASIPLFLWLMGTVLSSHGMGTTHYFKVFTQGIHITICRRSGKQDRHCETRQYAVAGRVLSSVSSLSASQPGLCTSAYEFKQNPYTCQLSVRFCIWSVQASVEDTGFTAVLCAVLLAPREISVSYAEIPCNSICHSYADMYLRITQLLETDK
jgi:hypothetical protein